jgi:hypothetical protein
MLLDISLGGIFYLNSKRSGDIRQWEISKYMFLIQNRNTTEEMKNYMSSPKWKALVRPERLLFQAANHSFDLTMDKLGHHNVA